MKFPYLKSLLVLVLIGIWTYSSIAIELTGSSAGALLYFKQNGKIWVLLGYDRNYGCWCDFGGKSEGSEKPENTALRELREETRYIYGDSIPVTLAGYYQSGVYRQYVVEVPYCPEMVLLNASVSPEDDPALEMIAYIWIPLVDLCKAIKAAKKNYDNVELPPKYSAKCYLLHSGKIPIPDRKFRKESAKTLDAMTQEVKTLKTLFQLSDDETTKLYKAIDE
ncbi:MAG: NUDIX hydrolase [Calditrichia bacterium]|nr:NUDIX hydrolase [Calditrichia bacterium]